MPECGGELLLSSRELQQGLPALGAQTIDELANVLGLVPPQDQQGIAGVHNDQILHAHCGDHPVHRRVNEYITRTDVQTLGNPEYLASLQQALRDWAPLLGRSAATLLVLTETAVSGQYAEGLPLPFAADLRLLFERQRWLSQRRQIAGYVTRVTVVKSRSGAMGGRTDLTIKIAQE